MLIAVELLISIVTVSTNILIAFFFQNATSRKHVPGVISLKRTKIPSAVVVTILIGLQIALLYELFMPLLIMSQRDVSDVAEWFHFV